MQHSYKIGYYVAVDIQHIPPIISLYPHLGGVVFTRNRKIFNHLTNKYGDMGIPIVYKTTEWQLQKEIVRRRIRIMIYTGYQTLYCGKAVQIFHGGLSDKTYVESLLILLYDLVLFPGEKTKDKVARSGYLKKIPEWEIIGYPKFDPLIDGSLRATRIFQNNRKIILYAPTWPSQKRLNVSKIVRFSEFGESSLELWVLDIIRELSPHFNLCIKYHSRIYREPGDIYEQVDALIARLGVGDYVQVLQDDNILPYMAKANLMISDMSTACYEWFHFDRPIVFANPSPEHYRRSDDISSNTYAWQAGDVINKKEDILRLIETNLSKDSYRDIRNKIFRYTVFQPDGHSVERQAQAILNFCKRYENVPYFWFMGISFVSQMWRRFVISVRNRYYHIGKKEKIGR